MQNIFGGDPLVVSFRDPELLYQDGRLVQVLQTMFCDKFLMDSGIVERVKLCVGLGEHTLQVVIAE